MRLATPLLFSIIIYLSFFIRSVCQDLSADHCKSGSTESCSYERRPWVTAKWSGLLGNLIRGFQPLFIWDNATELEERRMRSFARNFAIRCAKDDMSMQELKIVKEESAVLGWGRFDPELIEKVDNGTRVSISFAFKYFEHLGHDKVRKLFGFPEHVHDAASSFVKSIRERYSGNERIVGVHLRRGDKVWEFDRFNEWSHSVGYLSRALAVIDSIWRGVAVAAVVTDDPAWASAVLRGRPGVHISPQQTTNDCKMAISCSAPLVDMAILTMCDAVIVSGSSTFSWWGAYLASESSIVIAPRLIVNPKGPFGPCIESPPQHALCSEYHSLDYYPPDWILLDEVPHLNVYPAWWGPSLELREITMMEGKACSMDAGSSAECGRGVRLTATVQHVEGMVCLYIDGVLNNHTQVAGTDRAVVELAAPVSSLAVSVRPWLGLRAFSCSCPQTWEVEQKLGEAGTAEEQLLILAEIELPLLPSN